MATDKTVSGDLFTSPDNSECIEECKFQKDDLDDFDFRNTLTYWKVFEQKRRRVAKEEDIRARGDSQQTHQQSNQRVDIVPELETDTEQELEQSLEKKQFRIFVWLPLTVAIMAYITFILFCDKIVSDLYEKDCDCIDIYKFFHGTPKPTF